MNWIVTILVTAILFTSGMSAIYAFLDPSSAIADIVGGMVGIGSATIGIIAGEKTDDQ